MTKEKLNLTEIETGDVFFEESHYVYNGKKGKTHEFTHVESGEKVTLGDKYVEQLLVSADQFVKEIEVGREDKFWTQKQLDEAISKKEVKLGDFKEGDLKQKGIRSLWAGIHSSVVFTVCFNKQGKELSKKALEDAKRVQLADAIEKINAAKTGKKGVAATAESVIKEIQENPITGFEKGEERVLRGYKTQFESINGSYDVVDMDLPPTNNKRKVNVNEINWLVVNGVKYTVK